MPAVVDMETCTGCTICVGSCPVEVITMVDDKAIIDAEGCIDCGACVNECPVDAISM